MDNGVDARCWWCQTPLPDTGRRFCPGGRCAARWAALRRWLPGPVVAVIAALHP